MKYIKDFHGFNITEAIKDIDLIVGDARLGKEATEAEFITGRGPIRNAIMDRLTYTYKLDPHYQFGNDGVIVVTIE